MKRSFTKSAVGESAFRYKVRYESEECPHTSFSYRTEQTGLLTLAIGRSRQDFLEVCWTIKDFLTVDLQYSKLSKCTIGFEF
jgi:hypothetical protein